MREYHAQGNSTVSHTYADENLLENLKNYLTATYSNITHLGSYLDNEIKISDSYAIAGYNGIRLYINLKGNSFKVGLTTDSLFENNIYIYNAYLTVQTYRVPATLGTYTTHTGLSLMVEGDKLKGISPSPWNASSTTSFITLHETEKHKYCNINGNIYIDAPSINNKSYEIQNKSPMSEESDTAIVSNALVGGHDIINDLLVVRNTSFNALSAMAINMDDKVYRQIGSYLFIEDFDY